MYFQDLKLPSMILLRIHTERSNGLRSIWYLNFAYRHWSTDDRHAHGDRITNIFFLTHFEDKFKRSTVFFSNENWKLLFCTAVQPSWGRRLWYAEWASKGVWIAQRKQLWIMEAEALCQLADQSRYCFKISQRSQLQDIKLSYPRTLHVQ